MYYVTNVSTYSRATSRKFMSGRALQEPSAQGERHYLKDKKYACWHGSLSAPFVIPHTQAIEKLHQLLNIQTWQ